MTTICIIYIIRYGQKVKKDPTKSLIYDQKEEIEALFKSNLAQKTVLNWRLRLVLLIFISSFIVMIYGVSKLEWWFLEMTSVFFVGSVLIGIVANIKEETFVNTFVKGAGELLGVAFIIGIARGVSVLM